MGCQKRPGRTECQQNCCLGNELSYTPLNIEDTLPEQTPRKKKRNLCKPTCRVQNPDTQRAGRVGTAQGGWRGGAMLGKTKFRHFSRLGSQPRLWPSSAM